MRDRWTALVLVLAPTMILTLPGAGLAPTGPAQVLIIRHGEKPGDPASDDDAKDPDLAPKGYERAGALAIAIPTGYAKVDFLFATKASKNSNRPVETITPLSVAIHEPIDSKHADADYAKVADDILHNAKYAGKRVLICWHHGTIPELAQALGVAKDKVPCQWTSYVFDRVWRIDYTADGKATLTDLPQKLLFGDSGQ